MLKNLLNKIIGDPDKKTLKKLQPLVDQINDIEKKYQDEL